MLSWKPQENSGEESCAAQLMPGIVKNRWICKTITSHNSKILSWNIVHKIWSDPETHIKGTVSQDFLLLVFFHESVSPQPRSIPLGSFRFFSKIRGDVRKSRCTTGINNTGGKFCHQFRYLSILVAMTRVANNGNNIRLLRPENKREGKFIYMLTLQPKGDQTK